MTEGPYKLPEGWRWVRLGDVARIFSGSPAPQDKRYFEEGSMPFVRVQDLGRYGITTNLTETSDKVNGEAVKELRLVKANKGTILFPKSGAAILTNSRAILGEDAYIVSHLAAVEPFHDVLETLWAFYWLCTVDMGRYIDNPAYPSLRLSKIRELLIPLPPLEEQRRIVARVEELMSRIREAKRLRQEAKEEAERLWQSILSETFPKPGTELPEGWQWVKLVEIAWRDSVILRPNDNPKVVVRYLGMEHISPGQWDEPTPIELFGAEIRSQVVMYRPGLVLYGRLRPYLNKVVVPSSEGVASTEFVPIAVNKDVLSPHYLGAYLRSPWFVTYATRNTTGSRQPRVRLDALWNAPIPLPPLEEQRRIVAYLQDVQEKIRALKEAQA
jgi:type I restriction enzyme S subunit